MITDRPVKPFVEINRTNEWQTEFYTATLFSAAGDQPAYAEEVFSIDPHSPMFVCRVLEKMIEQAWCDGFAAGMPRISKCEGSSDV